jgi:hypothetical protein
MFAKSVQFSPITNSVFLLDRNIDTAIGFEFFSEQLEPYTQICNQTFVTSCVTTQSPAPQDIVQVEFIATDDTCFKILNVLKKSEDETPAVEMQTNDDGLIGVIIRFFKYETACLPSSMSYRLYGFNPVGARILLSQGLLIFK